jgi:hypothetical protein
MSDNDRSFWSQHLGNIFIAVIGAVAAIVAAVIPLVWNQPAPPPAETKTMDKAAANQQAPGAPAPSLVGTWDVRSNDGQTVAVTFDTDGRYRAGDRVGVWKQNGRKFTQELTKADRIVRWEGELSQSGDEFTARNQNGLQVTGRKR